VLITTGSNRVTAPSACRQLEKKGLVMVGSVCKRGDFAWVQDVRANYICIHKGELRATVFSNEWLPWQIIFHYVGQNAVHLQSESFGDPSIAMSYAEKIINGAVPEYGDLVALPLSWQPTR
jgi:hypothetical protein